MTLDRDGNVYDIARRVVADQGDQPSSAAAGDGKPPPQASSWAGPSGSGGRQVTPGMGKAAPSALGGRAAPGRAGS